MKTIDLANTSPCVHVYVCVLLKHGSVYENLARARERAAARPWTSHHQCFHRKRLFLPLSKISTKNRNKEMQRVERMNREVIEEQ